MLDVALRSILSAVVAGLFTSILVRWLADYADRRDWVDAPGGRKQHKHKVPVVGGLAMLLGGAVATALLGRNGAIEWQLLGALALTAVVGWIDDRHPIRAPHRMALQALAAFIACGYSGVVLHHVGSLTGIGYIELGKLALPFTILALVGTANSINLIDGLDGLAGGISFIALSWFSVLIVGIEVSDRTNEIGALLIVVMAFAGAIVGFLRFNLRSALLPQAEVFMGSAGSVTLGLLLGWIAVRTTQSFGAHAPYPTVAVWILALPIFDTLSCMLRRLQAGRSPAAPDRRHMHHLLLAQGARTVEAVKRLHAIAVGCGAIGVAGWAFDVPESLMFWTLLAAFVCYHVYACRYWAKIDAAKSRTGRGDEGVDMDAGASGMADARGASR